MAPSEVSPGGTAKPPPPLPTHAVPPGPRRQRSNEKTLSKSVAAQGLGSPTTLGYTPPPYVAPAAAEPEAEQPKLVRRESGERPYEESGDGDDYF